MINMTFFNKKKHIVLWETMEPRYNFKKIPALPFGIRNQALSYTKYIFMPIIKLGWWIDLLLFIFIKYSNFWLFYYNIKPDHKKKKFKYVQKCWCILDLFILYCVLIVLLFITKYQSQKGKGGAYQNILKKIDLPIVPRGSCLDLLRLTKQLGPTFKLHQSFMCAGGEIGIDSCQVSTCIINNYYYLVHKIIFNSFLRFCVQGLLNSHLISETYSKKICSCILGH